MGKIEMGATEQRFRSFEEYDQWLNDFIGYERKMFLEVYGKKRSNTV